MEDVVFAKAGKGSVSLAALLWVPLALLSALASANNPCIMDAYTADATPLWVNNTMYLYCSHDANFVTGQTGYNIPDDVLISSTDLVNWEDEGVIVTSGVGNPWAPAVVYLNGTYYLYYTAGGGSIGVLTSTSPNGPFAGGNKSLVTGATSDPGMGGNLLDPAAFVDTTGQAYLYFGGGGPGTGAGSCSRVIKLNANMISVNGSGSGVPAPNFFEASGINVRNGIYYHSYSSDPAFGMNIEYIMANNPLFTNPTIPAQPIVVANGGAGNCYNNQGGGLVNIGTTWYVAYFNRALAIANGLACAQGAYQRSVCFDQVNFNADGTIQQATLTTLGPTALKNVDAFSTQRAACMAAQGGVAPAGLSEKGPQTEACSEGGRDLTAIVTGDWVEVRNLAFGTCAASFSARVASTSTGGSIQVRLNSTTGTLLGTLTVPNTGGMQTWQTVSCPVTGASGVHDLYFVFTGTFNFQSYSFTTCGSPTPSPASSATATRTVTATGTRTRTGTPSATATGTATATSTRTSTPSPSATPTASPTQTKTSSLTATPSVSPTSSPRSSPSPSVTLTSTAVWTPSVSVTESATASPAASATASFTELPSLSATATDSPSATLTLTPSATLTPSTTALPTRTPSPRPTAMASASPSATVVPSVGPSFSPTVQPSVASTAAVGDGLLKIIAAGAVPNPDPKEIRVDLAGSVDSIRGKVYTVGLVDVRSLSWGPQPAGWTSLALDSVLAGLPSGPYYISLRAYRDRGVSPPFLVKVYVLR